jgi:hypothetical protein
MNAPTLLFDKFDSDRCHRNWKASCGPHSIAAVCHTTLDEIRKHMPHLKGWMSPTNITDVLDSMGIRFKCVRIYDRSRTLRPGINRIQFEGDWLEEGQPPKLAYFHTHYVGMQDGYVLDAAVEPAKWLPMDEWYPAIDNYSNFPPQQGWHVTHGWKITPGPPRL